MYGLGPWKKLHLLKGHTMDLGCTGIHPFCDSAPGPQVKGHQWHMGRKWSVSGETASSQAKLQRSDSGTVPSASTPSAKQQSHDIGSPTLANTQGSTPYNSTGALTQGVKQLYLIHRNTHKEAARWRKQRNVAQMQEQNKTPEKELNKLEISKPIRCKVQNTGYQQQRRIISKCVDI